MEADEETLEIRASHFTPDGQNVLFALCGAALSLGAGYALYEPDSIRDALSMYEITAPAALISLTGYVMGSMLRD